MSTSSQNLNWGQIQVSFNNRITMPKSMSDPGFLKLLEYKSLTAGRTDENMADSKFTLVSILQQRVKLIQKSVCVNSGTSGGCVGERFHLSVTLCAYAETIRLIRDVEPRTATLTFTQLLSSEVKQ